MKSPVTMRFSAAAPTYDRLAAVQRKTAERLMVLLDCRPAPARILEIGCGTGVLTALLARKFPSARIDAVDISSAMTDKARANLNENKKINWIVADARNLPPLAQYDLIASSCALHWITPLDPVIENLGALRAAKGRLAIAVMTRGTLAELNICRQKVAPHKPPRIILPDKGDIRRAVAKAGLKIISEESETIRSVYASPEQILRQLHDQGLTGGNIPRHNHLLTRSEISRLIADYSDNYKNKNGVYATYRVFYCVAKKK